MTGFESNGRFWLPGTPEKSLIGRLVWDDDGGTELTTFGSFKNDNGNRWQPIPLLHGVVEKTPHAIGRSVTLWDSYPTRYTSSSTGLDSGRYRSPVTLTGQHLAVEQSVEFASIELGLSLLGAWAEKLTGLESSTRIQDKALHIGCSYTYPPALVIPCDNVTLQIGTTAFSHQRRRRYTIEESVILEVIPAKRMRFTELYDTFVYPLQNFITFAMNSPARVDQWFNRLPKVDGSEVSPQIDVSYSRLLSSATRDEHVSHVQPLFNLEHVNERLPSVFTNWLNATTHFHAAFNLYFACRYHRRMDLDWRFQNILHALTLYGRSEGSPATRDETLQRILENVGPDDASYLKKLLDTSLFLYAESVLEQLMEEHGSDIEWLVGKKCEYFVNRVLNTYQYLLHRKPFDYVPTVEGELLYTLTETLDWLMKLCLLKEIGFSQDERSQLLRSNQNARLISTHAKNVSQE